VVAPETRDGKLCIEGAVAQSGSAPRSHRGGQGFNSPQLHQKYVVRNTDRVDAVGAQAPAAFLFPTHCLADPIGTVLLKSFDDGGPCDIRDCRLDAIVVGVDEELLEPGLVVVPAAGFVAEPVGVAAAVCQVKYRIECGLVAVLRHRQPRECALSGEQLIG
jgi:hypothetical protein